MRPGTLEVRARARRPVSALRRDDLPTLERPAKATSGSPASGMPPGSAAEVTNRHSFANRRRPASTAAASVSGLYFAHPESRYFAVGKIGRDQVLDYQRRKGLDLQSVERWLGPNLNYSP